jgi:hypothetical protein
MVFHRKEMCSCSPSHSRFPQGMHTNRFARSAFHGYSPSALMCTRFAGGRVSGRDVPGIPRVLLRVVPGTDLRRRLLQGKE